MLFLLIPLAWLAIVALVVILCQSAARSDAAPAQVVQAPMSSPRPGLVVWELTRERRGGGRHKGAEGRRARSRRLAHGVR
ncbi:MAG TPA: hypothetical protein VED41_11105 [Solirubrobacteraceae bacterium]|nr:hypothetical protein [Solirubrobacteraceae bacterium]